MIMTPILRKDTDGHYTGHWASNTKEKPLEWLSPLRQVTCKFQKANDKEIPNGRHTHAGIVSVRTLGSGLKRNMY